MAACPLLGGQMTLQDRSRAERGIGQKDSSIAVLRRLQPEAIALTVGPGRQPSLTPRMAPSARHKNARGSPCHTTRTADFANQAAIEGIESKLGRRDPAPDEEDRHREEGNE